MRIHITSYILQNTLFLVFLATYSRTVSSNESFLAMSFSTDNMHKEFKRSSVMVARNLFFIKDSFEKFLSASQLVTTPIGTTSPRRYSPRSRSRRSTRSASACSGSFRWKPASIRGSRSRTKPRWPGSPPRRSMSRCASREAWSCAIRTCGCCSRASRRRCSQRSWRSCWIGGRWHCRPWRRS